MSYSKNGDYGAPPGLLYMQAQEEYEEKTKQIIEDLKRYAPDLSAENLFEDQSTFDSPS